jgi:uncharacterized membrane protein YkvA (DUF1232 family)
VIHQIKERAASLHKESYAVYIAVRDPRVPWYARAFMGVVLAYVFSPIDLIPDFIPVLGYLDDLVIVPLGIALALKMIPTGVMSEAREQAEELIKQGKPVSKSGLALIISFWVICLAIVILLVVRGL